MRHGVARRVECKQFDAAPYVNHVTRVQTSIDAGNGILGIAMGKEFGAGGSDHRLVAAGVIAVLVSIEYLRNIPAIFFGNRQAFLVIQRLVLTVTVGKLKKLLILLVTRLQT